METVVLLVAAVLLPTASGYAYVGLRRLLALRQARRAPLPLDPPLPRVTADVRRLHELLDRAENAPSDSPAKYRRCVATRAAYVDALTSACRHLEVPLPAGRPVPLAEIYRVESDLRLRGLDVRPVG